MQELNNLYSKVKDIYIELNNYSFFHSPTSIDKIDSRFVGRKKLMDRLKNLLNNSETKSGAYLVTGYRGVGKTSLVNKVLAEVADIKPILSVISPQIITLIYLTLLWIIFENHKWNQWISFTLILIYLIYVCILSLKKGRTGLMKHVKYALYIPRVNNEAYKHIIFTLGKSLLLFAIYQLFQNTSLPQFLRSYWVLPLALAVSFLILVIIQKILLIILLKPRFSGNLFSRFIRTTNWFLEYTKKSLNKFTEKTKSFLNYRNRVTIKINLGHEDLKEGDILRIIAKNVRDKHQQLSSVFWRFPFNFKVLKFILLYFFVLAVFTTWTPEDQKHFFCESNLAYYFPSQIFGSEITKYSFESVLHLNENEMKALSLKWLVKSIAFLDFIFTKSYYQLLINIPLVDIPSHDLNYLFIISLLFLWYTTRQIGYYRPFGIVSHNIVNNRLTLLSQRITAHYSKEAGQRLGSKGSFLGLFRKSTLNYPIADVREIEGELISIFEDMDKIPSIMGKPSFIFVVDELDKIQSNQNKTIADKESEESEMEYAANEFIPSTEITRQRRQVVAMLLANLKHFFTTVRAKFIFIAGREMYDAALADISDRNYFLGSIFHEVIYVNSFLTEETEDFDVKHHDNEDHMSYHHTTVEEFVCQFILPSGYRPEDSRSLKTVSKYFLKLEGHGNIDSLKLVNGEVRRKVLKKISRNKILRFLSKKNNTKISAYILPNLSALIKEIINKVVEEKRDFFLTEIKSLLEDNFKVSLRQDEYILIRDELFERLKGKLIDDLLRHDLNKFNKIIKKNFTSKSAKSNKKENMSSLVSNVLESSVQQKKQEGTSQQTPLKEVINNFIFKNYINEIQSGLQKLNINVEEIKKKQPNLTKYEIVNQYIYKIANEVKIEFNITKGTYKTSFFQTVVLEVIGTKYIELFSKILFDTIVKKETEELTAKISQSIFHLKAFINYLTYRSGGTPKKLINLFEQYVYQYSVEGDKIVEKKSKSLLPQQAIYIGKQLKHGKTYLKFKPDDLYVFGLTNYLTVPFYYNIRRHVRHFGDKLMVSTSYLLDHFYKFHNEGFSWRNLEVTPEIIDINKAPVLRKLIHDIVDFLSYSNLEKITSGLYDYKFNSKIAHEIDYLSKISEKESAAFNFTLDESQEIKKHYKRKLRLVLKENERNFLQKDNKMGHGNFLHSVALIQQSLGDLYYYDQEYDDAITSYQDAIIMFRDESARALPTDLLVTVIRIMLKLGNTFERKSSFESALMAYDGLTAIILKSFEPRLEVKQLVKKSWFFQKSIFQTLAELDYGEMRFDLVNKKLTVETMRHLFQPFMAKLYAIEKVKKGGITWLDIEHTLDEIEFLLEVIPDESKRSLKTDLYNKIGDLLYFKNKDGNWLAKSLERYGPSKHFKEIKDEQKSCNFFYNEAIKCMLEERFLMVREPEAQHKLKTFEELKTLANNLSDLGDSFFPKDEEKVSFDKIKLFITRESWKLEIGTEGDNNFENAIAYYRTAYLVHIENDDHKQAAFQYLKILHLLAAKCNLETVGNQVKIIKENIINKILVSSFRAYNASSRPEIEKVKSIFKLDGELSDEFTSYIFKQLPQIGEIQEVIALYNFIKIKAKGIDTLSIAEVSPGYFPQLSSMYSRAVQLSIKVRANETIYKAIFDITDEGKDILLKDIDVNKESTSDKNFHNHFKEGNILIVADKKYEFSEKIDLLDYVIADSIYCLTELIRVLQNFGVNYATNHSFFGFAYEQRATWCKRHDNLLNTYQIKSNEKKENDVKKDNRDWQNRKIQLKQTIRNLIGAESMDKLKVKYNQEKALDYYTKCVELHEEKFVYNVTIQNIYYMDDDFNDNYQHFYSALERSKLTRIKIKKEELSKELETESKLYDIERYLF